MLALASLLLAVTAEEQKPSPMFSDFMLRQTSKAKTTSSYYEIESTHQCLKQVAYRNCRACAEGSGCYGLYVESKVACCHTDNYEKYGDKDENVLAEKATVGVCSYTAQQWPKEEIHYEGTSATKVGTFTATCELKEDADKCGSPFCEGLSIQVTGDILRYPDVAFPHRPERIDADEGCGAYFDASKKEVTAKTAKAQYDYYEKPKYWVGPAEIYSGTFYTVSRHHKIPYKFGQFQLVVGTSDAEEYDGVHELSNKAFVAKHEAIALEFFKEEGPYKA